MKLVQQILLAASAVLLIALPAGSHLRAQETEGLARIALVSDTHTTRGTNDDQPKHRARLDRVMAAANAAKVDLVLIAGDLTENGSPEEMSDFQNQIKGFKAPVLFVPGNHDVGNKLIPGKGGTVSAERVAAFEKALGPSFQAQTRAGLRVIGINSPIFGSGFEREKAMWEFLEKELARPAPLPTVVFLHYPPFVKQADEGGGEYWNIEPEPRARLLSLLQRGGVKTVLTGHLHRDLTNRHEGILFVTTRPVSFGLPKGKQAEGWTLVTLPAQGEAQVEPQTIGD